MMAPNKYQIIAFGLLLSVIPGVNGCKDKPDHTGSTAAYAIENPYYKGPLRVKIRLEKDTMPLSGLMSLEIAAEIDSDYELHFPSIHEALKQFKIKDTTEHSGKLPDNNKALKAYRYELEPLETGRCEIPALTFTFAPKDPEQQALNQSTLVTEPVWIEVTTSLPADVKDIEDIEDIVEMKARRSWIGPAAGAVVVIMIIAAAMLLRKKKQVIETRRIYKSAHQIAFEMLRAIADEKMVEQGHIKPFYEKLSGCLRQYIENRFQLRAPEQTTEEFLEHLKNSSLLKLEYKQELQKFLEHCDLVKFARYQPTHEQINESLSMAEQFVEKTKSDECLVDVTNQAERQ